MKFRLKWQSEHLAPPEEISEIQKMIYPNLATHYSGGKSVLFNKFDDSPKWPEFRNILKFFGTKAGVGVPLELDKAGIDVFAMDKVLTDYTWPEDIIEQAKTIGKVLLSAMLRREAEAEIQNGYSEIKRLKDQLQQENIYLKEEIKVSQNFDTIIGQSTALKYVLRRLEQVAPTDATVLLLGETGTGKELFAHALHQTSLRKHKPMIKVGCATLPSSLIESELFGHEKGSFTGAYTRKKGKLEIASGGTLVLDEIGDMPIQLQAKILRVLQEHEFYSVGGTTPIKVDLRIVSLTNKILKNLIAKGDFREDLYYRLVHHRITLPPLRDRKEDISPLINYFTGKFSEELGKNIGGYTVQVFKAMESYSWPGNIRQLENEIRRLVNL
ncbi:MAG: sigma 54-interacting transcriptional regulator, partial [Candidatus Aminicenantes bacterium]|nr:sigma 54-interacting transcriptional regulator [Candidatus Aminicenantes bacterium]